MTKRRPNLVLPEATWSKRWVVDCTPWGEGDEAVLCYLARYVFRVAITNSRIVDLDESGVTLRHKHRASNRWRTIRLTGHEFIRRFLQHVLPKGLHKVRYYGLWHSTLREHAAQARLLLLLQHPANSDSEAPSSPTIGDAADRPDNPTPTEPHICPYCKDGHLIRAGRALPVPLRRCLSPVPQPNHQSLKTRIPASLQGSQPASGDNPKLDPHARN